MSTELLGALRRRGAGGWAAAWLVLCLLLVQHAGLIHRVDHGSYGAVGTKPLTGHSAAARMAAPASQDHASSGIDTGAKRHGADTARQSTHSCVLFDGATQADGLCGVPPMPLLSHGKPLVPPGITWRWPHLPAQRSFLTRAPPAPLAFA